jgi:hypothetical protein
MGAMAARAIVRDLAVRRGRFGRVTRRALGRLARARVWLMTIRAGLVPLVGTGKLLRVTTPALAGSTTPMGLVTSSARLMTTARRRAFRGVTGITSGFARCGRLMRQPFVAALAGGMACPLRRQRELFPMTAIARRVLRECELELVWGMTRLAVRAAMERALVLRDLMAAAARARNHERLRRARVRIMASEAASARYSVGVVGVHVLVALGTGRGGRCADVVWRVAARTNRVRRHLGLSQHPDAPVTGATRRDLVLLELVRLVAADTLLVTARKECARRDERRRLGMASDARVDGVDSSSVLSRMAGRAHAVRRLTERSVARMDRLVTVRARSGGRCLSFVGTMTAHALGGRMHRDSRCLALLLRVAARAIFGPERGDDSSVTDVWCSAIEPLQRVIAGKRMAARAVCSN